jgi:hypothetical protein
VAKGKPVAVEIKGLKETLKALKEFPEGIEEMKDVHRKVGEVVLKKAHARMSSVSGRLKGAYKVGNIKSGAKITTTASVKHAGVSEFGGTIPRYKSGSRTHHKPTAKSVGLKSYYIYPAAEQSKSEIVRLYEEGIRELARRYNLKG